MFRKISIYDIAELNNSNITQDDNFTHINYLDTGNITKNKIDTLQLLEINKDKIPSRAKRKIKQKTIIYSTVRPNQEHYGFIDETIDNLIVSTGFTTIDCIDSNIDAKFLYYYLSQGHIVEYFQGIAENSVSSYPSMKPEDIGNLYINVPTDIYEQQKIAKVLSTLDKKIELNNKINQELEAMAKTLYDYWFVQFDFPDAEGKPYKSSGGKMVYSEALKRKIPEGWEVGNLLDIATYTNGLACQKYRPTSDEYLPVIKIREMKDGFTKNTEKVKRDIPEKLIVNDGDILFSWSASLEVIIWTAGQGGLNQHIFKVTSDKYPRSFYYFQLLWYLQHFKMIADLRKTTMGHITQDHLTQSRITIPPLDLVNQLDRKIKPFQEKQILLKQETQKLTQLRDWLLPMLMNGQVSVSEATEQVEQAEELMVAEPSVGYGSAKENQ